MTLLHRVSSYCILVRVVLPRFLALSPPMRIHVGLRNVIVCPYVGSQGLYVTWRARGDGTGLSQSEKLARPLARSKGFQSTRDSNTRHVSYVSAHDGESMRALFLSLSLSPETRRHPEFPVGRLSHLECTGSTKVKP